MWQEMPSAFSGQVPSYISLLLYSYVLSMGLSMHLFFLSPSIYLYIKLSIYLAIYLSLSQCMNLSIYESIYLCIYP